MIRHPCGSPPHVFLFGFVAGQPQRDVRLDGGGQVSRSAKEGGPGAVGALVAPDPSG